MHILSGENKIYFRLCGASRQRGVQIFGNSRLFRPHLCQVEGLRRILYAKIFLRLLSLANAGTISMENWEVEHHLTYYPLSEALRAARARLGHLELGSKTTSLKKIKISFVHSTRRKSTLKHLLRWGFNNSSIKHINSLFVGMRHSFICKLERRRRIVSRAW